MRRWLGVVVAVAVVAMAVGFVIGSRSGQPDAGAPADVQRLQVAAWVQDWPTGDPAGETSLAVSPDGVGTTCATDSPCSLAAAQQKARTLSPTATSDVVVSLAGGVYELDDALGLGPSDSGHNGHRVVYRARPGERPVLSRGTPVTAWRPAEDRPGEFVGDVAAGSSSRLLHVNGTRATRARGPDNPEGWSKIAEGFRAPDDEMARWAHPEVAEIVSFAEWRSFRCRVAAVKGSELTMAQPCWRNATAPESHAMNDVTWVENALELLDEPGEWYLDEASNRVHYRPHPGEDMGGASTSLSAPGPLLEVQGTATDPVHDIGIEGLTFAYAGWDAPSTDTGYAGAQAGWHSGADAATGPLDIERTPGAVTVAHARHIRLQHNRFEHLGGAGLDVAAGTQDLGVVGNRFSDISGSAIQIGEVREGAQNPVPSDQLDRLQVTNNLIDRVAVEFPDGVGIFASYVSNASVQHNEVNHLPYTGISLGWGWGTDSYARNNLIADNRISDVVATLHDGGAIYTLSPMPGTVIERNYITDQHNSHGAIYLDEGTAFVTVADNVIERVPRWLHIWTASIHDNTIVDNYTDTTDMIDDGTRNTVARNHSARSEWPAGAQKIIDNAGLEPAYASLREDG